MKKVPSVALLSFCLLVGVPVMAQQPIEDLASINAIQQSRIQQLTEKVEALQQQVQALIQANQSFLKIQDANATFVTQTNLNSRLSSYVTHSSLSSTLGSYSTISNLNSRLSSYVTHTDFRDKIGKCRIALGHSDKNNFHADRWGDTDWAFDFDRNALKLVGDVNSDDTIFYDFGCFW